VAPVLAPPSLGKAEEHDGGSRRVHFLPNLAISPRVSHGVKTGTRNIADNNEGVGLRSD
jgi:hypothetical protein